MFLLFVSFWFSVNIQVTLKVTTYPGYARGNHGSDGPELPVVMTTGGPGDMETEGPTSPPHPFLDVSSAQPAAVSYFL